MTNSVGGASMALIGRWAFVIGLIISVLAGFTTISYSTSALFVLGLIVGFLNVNEKESHHFLLAVIALLLVGSSVDRLTVSPTNSVATIVSTFSSFVSAAGLVVAIKEVLNFAKD